MAIEPQVVLVYRKLVTEAKVALSESVVLGNCSDHATYRYYCGEIRGLTAALELLDEANKQMHGERSPHDAE